jgi:hypothetical protein
MMRHKFFFFIYYNKMIKTKIKQKQKTIVQTIDSIKITNIIFDDIYMNILVELNDENDMLIDRKNYIYKIEDFNIFNKILKRILNDEDLKEIEKSTP